MVPSPAVRGVVVGGNCAMRRAFAAERAKLAVACSQRPIRAAYMHGGPHDTYPPYLDQGLIQTVSIVSGPRYS